MESESGKHCGNIKHQPEKSRALFIFYFFLRKREALFNNLQSANVDAFCERLDRRRGGRKEVYELNNRRYFTSASADVCVK